MSPGPAGSCRNFRTGCSTGSTGSGSGNTAATAERTVMVRKGDDWIKLAQKKTTKQNKFHSIADEVVCGIIICSPAGTAGCSSAAADCTTGPWLQASGYNPGCNLGTGCSFRSCIPGCSCLGCNFGCNLDCSSEAVPKRKRI